MAFFLVINGKTPRLMSPPPLERKEIPVFFHRCSLLGFDLNRVWSDPSTWAHPEIHGIKTHVMNLNANSVKIEEKKERISFK